MAAVVFQELEVTPQRRAWRRLLRLLHLRSDGLEQLAQGQGGVAAQISSIERELKTTLDDYLETKASAQTLEARLYQIDNVLDAVIQANLHAQMPMAGDTTAQ